MYHLRKSIPFARISLRPPPVSRRYLIQDTTGLSPPSSEQPNSEPDSDDIDEKNPDEPEDYEWIAPTTAVLCALAFGSVICATFYYKGKEHEEARAARAKIFNAHSDREWLTAIRVANEKDTKTGTGGNQGEKTTQQSLKSQPESPAPIGECQG